MLIISILFLYLLVFIAGDEKADLHSAFCLILGRLQVWRERKRVKDRRVKERVKTKRPRVVFPFLFLCVLVEWSSLRERAKITCQDKM